jgi:hypothetical protein
MLNGTPRKYQHCWYNWQDNLSATYKTEKMRDMVAKYFSVFNIFYQILVVSGKTGRGFKQKLTFCCSDWFLSVAIISVI